MNVAIVGGGIGGLTAALALQRRGIGVCVFEKAPAYEAAGAGIVMASNAMAVLQRLGVAGQLGEMTIPITRGEIRTAKGRLLSVLDTGGFSRRLGAPTLPLHRADLQRVLLDALENDTVTTHKTCTGFEEDGGNVHLMFADGGRESADVLIGADGVRSVVREQLLGHGAPTYRGYVAWRGVAEGAADLVEPGLTQEAWGHGMRFGWAAIGRNRIYWFAVAGRADMPRPAESVSKRALLDQFSHFYKPLPEFIEATAEADILLTPISDREPATQWGRGHVTLLGDAAHPMTPNMGQGGCQAVEDAAELARCLASGADVPRALREYERLRQPRTAAIVNASRGFGALAQWQNPIACALRNSLIRLSPSSMAARRVEGLLTPPATVLD